MDNPLMLVSKGLRMKKKRVGGAAGTFPTSHGLGIISEDHRNANTSPLSMSCADFRVEDMNSGNTVISGSVADYNACVLNSANAINDTSGGQMRPGAFTVAGCIGVFDIIIELYVGVMNFNHLSLGTADFTTSVKVNSSPATVTVLTPNPSTNLNGFLSHPFDEVIAIQINTASLSSAVNIGDIVIEVEANVSNKSGPVGSTGTTNPVAGAAINGSFYLSCELTP